MTVSLAAIAGRDVTTSARVMITTSFFIVSLLFQVLLRLSMIIVSSVDTAAVPSPRRRLTAYNVACILAVAHPTNCRLPTGKTNYRPANLASSTTSFDRKLLA